jgi:hypothetical protein
MAYSEEARVQICQKCGSVNRVLVAYSGDGRANERETAACFNCGNELDHERCWVIVAAESTGEATQRLRKIQSR